MYPKELGVKVFRASTLVYFDELFLLSYISELQHSFVSAEGKAESYNETFLNSDNVRYFNTFLFFNPEVGRKYLLRGVNILENKKKLEKKEIHMKHKKAHQTHKTQETRIFWEKF